MKHISEDAIVRVLSVALSILLCSAWFYYVCSLGEEVKIVYCYTYIVPVLLAGYFYGLTGGVFIAILVSAIYALFTYSQQWEMEHIFPMASFVIVGLFTGMLSSKNAAYRKDIEQKITQISTIYDVSQAITSTLNIDALLRLITAKITKVLKCEISSILLINPQTKYLEIKASRGLDMETIRTTHIAIGEKVSGWVIQHGEPIFVKDIETDPRFARRSAEKYYTKSFISAPVKIKDECIGVVNVNNKVDKSSFSEGDFQVLKEFVSRASVAIENARLHRRLQDMYLNTIKALAAAIDARDHYTRYHSEHVTEYSVSIARQMGLPEEHVQKIREAAQLHDLGKIGIHDQILVKVGKLTEEEWTEIKQHTLKGAEILEPLGFLDGVVKIVKYHHERYGGGGYPAGLSGEEIPIGARIIAVADSFDAMVSERPYRKARGYNEAVTELKKCAGGQFDPSVVEAFLKVLGR